MARRREGRTRERGWAGALGVGCVGLLGCGGQAFRPPPLGDEDGGAPSPTPGDASGTLPEGSPGGRSPDAAVEVEAGPSGPVFTVSGTVVENDGTTGVPGAQMCAWGTTTCVTTDPSGAFSLPGVPATGSGVSGTLTGYFKGLWPFTLGGDLTGITLRLRTSTELTTWAAYMGVSTSQLSARGAILALAYSPGSPDVPLASVTVSSDPAGTIGYFTMATPSQPSIQVGETTASGEALILGVPAASAAVVTFSHAGLTCSADASDGWPSAQPNTVAVPAPAGVLTLARVLCK